jgi:hypothetical protein
MKILVLGMPYAGKTTIILDFIKKNKHFFFLDIKNYKKKIKYKSSFHSILKKTFIFLKNFRIVNILFFFIIHLKLQLVFRFIKYFLIQLELLCKSANKKFIIQDEGVVKKIYDSMSLDCSKNHWWFTNYKTINSLMLFTVAEYDMLLIVSVSKDKIINRIKKRADFNINENKASFIRRHVWQQKIYYNFFRQAKTAGIKCIFIKNKKLSASASVLSSALSN